MVALGVREMVFGKWLKSSQKFRYHAHKIFACYTSRQKANPPWNGGKFGEEMLKSREA